MPTNKNTLSVYIEDELLEKIEEKAKEENRSKNNLIVTVLKKEFQ